MWNWANNCPVTRASHDIDVRSNTRGSASADRREFRTFHAVAGAYQAGFRSDGGVSGGCGGRGYGDPAPFIVEPEQYLCHGQVAVDLGQQDPSPASVRGEVVGDKDVAFGQEGFRVFVTP